MTVSKKSGVSLNISVDYLSPGTGGEVVEIDARVRVSSARIFLAPAVPRPLCGC